MHYHACSVTVTDSLRFRPRTEMPLTTDHIRNMTNTALVYLKWSEEPIVWSLKPQEPGNDAPPVARYAERQNVVASRSDVQGRVHENNVRRPEQTHSQLVSGLRWRVEDTVASVPVRSPFLHQRRVVNAVHHTVVWSTVLVHLLVTVLSLIHIWRCRRRG